LTTLTSTGMRFLTNISIFYFEKGYFHQLTNPR